MLTVREKFIAYYVAVVTSGVCKKRSRSEITSKLSELRNTRNRDISNAEAHKIATSVTAHIAYVFENNSEISDFSEAEPLTPREEFIAEYLWVQTVGVFTESPRSEYDLQLDKIVENAIRAQKITEPEHQEILDEICEELFVATQLVNHNRFENDTKYSWPGYNRIFDPKEDPSGDWGV